MNPPIAARHTARPQTSVRSRSFEAIEAPPPLETAWAAEPSSPSTVQPEPDPAPNQAPKPHAAPLPHAPTVPASTGSEDLIAIPESRGPSVDHDEMLWVAVGAGALVVLGISILVLAVQAGSPECDAKEGFGCAEIHVLPLASF